MTNKTINNMMKRFFILSLTMILTLTAWGQVSQREVVKTYDFNWSDATKENLYFATFWRVKNNVYYHEKALSDEAFINYETDIASGLKFTAAATQLAYRSEGLYINKDNSATSIKLPELSQGNIIEISSKGGTAGQYLTPTVDLSDDGIQVFEGSSPDESTTNSQTYKYEIKASNGTYSLKAKLNASSLTGIAYIKVYASATEGAEVLYDWNFQNMLTDEQKAKIPTNNVEWRFGSDRYYKGFGTNTAASTNGTAIAELDGLTFTTTANDQIRLAVGTTNALFLLRNTEASVTVPVAKAGSLVTIVASQSGIADATGTDPITPTTTNSGKTSVFEIANAGSFSFKNGNGSSGKDMNVTSVKVEGPLYATVSGGSPANGSLSFASAGNEVDNVTNGFYSGSTVTITATPDAGYELGSLSGTYYQDAENTAVALIISGEGNTRTFTMPSTGNVSLTATFTAIDYTVQSTSHENGTVTFSKEENGDYTTSITDAHIGETIYVKATANENYEFSSLTSSDVENLTSAATTSFTMPAKNVDITATFTATQVAESTVGAEKTWTFNTLTENTVYNTVTQIDNDYYLRALVSESDNPNRTFTVKSGNQALSFIDGKGIETSKYIEANGQLNTSKGTAPAAGNTAGDATKAGLPSFAFNASVAGTTFAKIKYTGNASDNVRHRMYFANADGTTAVVNVSMVPTSDIDEVKMSSNAAGSFFITDLSGNGKYEIYAVRFVPATTIKVPTGLMGGTVTADKATANEGEEVTLTVTPADGYQLKEGTLKAYYISANGTETEVTITDNKFTKPAYYVYVKAEFEEAAPTVYNITMTQSTGGTVGVKVGDADVTTENTTAPAGTEITLTITTAENYTLKSISATGVTLNGSGTTRTFTMPSAAVTVKAVWEEKTQESAKTEVTENVDIVDNSNATVTSVEVGAETTSITISGTVNDGNQDVPVTSIADGTFTEENTANVQSIDLSNTQVNLDMARTDASSPVKDVPANTLIYLPEGCAMTGDNVIIKSGDNFTCTNFVMDGSNGTGKSYSVPKAFTAANVSLGREFDENVAATVCLPYALTQAQAEALGTFYYFSSVTGTVVNMTQATTGLDANKPYMFLPNSTVGSNNSVTATNVSVSISGTQSTGKTSGEVDFTFQGVIADKTFTSDEINGGIYGFAADASHGASVGQFVKCTEGAFVKAFRAYLICGSNLTSHNRALYAGGLPEVLTVKLINSNGSTTTIGQLQLMDADEDAARYNIKGQRVDKSYKGLVIKNGKKVYNK